MRRRARGAARGWKRPPARPRAPARSNREAEGRWRLAPRARPDRLLRPGRALGPARRSRQPRRRAHRGRRLARPRAARGGSSPASQSHLRRPAALRPSLGRHTQPGSRPPRAPRAPRCAACRLRPPALATAHRRADPRPHPATRRQASTLRCSFATNSSSTRVPALRWPARSRLMSSQLVEKVRPARADSRREGALARLVRGRQRRRNGGSRAP